MSHQFPRMLYRADDQVIVNDAAEQSTRERDGFMTFEAWRSEEKPKPKPKRKPKAE